LFERTNQAHKTFQLGGLWEKLIILSERVKKH